MSSMVKCNLCDIFFRKEDDILFFQHVITKHEKGLNHWLEQLGVKEHVSFGH